MTADWLVSNGVDKRIATLAAADEDFREDLGNHLQMGLERLIVVSGTRDLGVRLELGVR